jgi:nitric oxide reductase subunit B
MSRQKMPISRLWFQGAILTYLIGFTILGILTYLTYAQQPPVPQFVKSASGEVLFTRSDIFDGMNVFRRYGLMEYGSIYGHGAYLGPDFTADYLHRSATILLDKYSEAESSGAHERVATELHTNNYDPTTESVIWSDTRSKAHSQLLKHYEKQFSAPVPAYGMQINLIQSKNDIRTLTAFFAWTAWTASANRPTQTYSYTNNWPPDTLAGNSLTGDAIFWSALSIITLLGGTGLILFFFGRYDWLGWSERKWPIQFRKISEVSVTPAQKVLVWFFVATSLFFLIQTLVGGLAAHYRAEPGSFFGINVSSIMPFNIARTWHLQLAIFWVATAYVASGIFLAPLISGIEPKKQAPLSLALLGALALVVIGSLAGEYASIKGLLTEQWFWFGHQGWEYLDLGRLWQVLLVLGLCGWVYILWRGLRPSLKRNEHGNMPWLLLYAALAIPAFYAVGLLATRKQGFAVADFWRFWVVHLWVEDFLELFTTVIVAYIFVLLGLVREKIAIRIIYLDVILYSIGGVVGTMHHLYFSGTPAAHMALGATFSAMEVIPLLLLTLEGWAFMRSGERSIADSGHPHKWAVWFLISVGFWNFLGAGVFGFLINLPAVSYYEIGTNLTANHAHTSMMGVYGMLAIGLLLFCLRYLTQENHWSDRAAKLSFFSLNIGLTWMSFVSLFPVGLVQLYKSLTAGYFSARSPEFLNDRLINFLEWVRLPGDALFILGGALPICWICWKAVRYPNTKIILPNTEFTTRLYIETSGEGSLTEAEE